MKTKMRGTLATTLPAGPESVVDRLRRGIAEAGLDRGCREAADDMLDRVRVEEDLLRRAGGLADVRKRRDAIVIVRAPLGELDGRMPDEPGRSAFYEIAGLFQAVADFAGNCATAAIRAAGQGNA